MPPRLSTPLSAPSSPVRRRDVNARTPERSAAVNTPLRPKWPALASMSRCHTRPARPSPQTPQSLTASLAAAWHNAAPSVVRAAKNAASVAAIGVLFASHRATQFHTLGIGQQGLLALYAGPGGWAAIGCHVLGAASAVFGAAWGLSKATPNDRTGAAAWYARHWPGVVLGLSLAVSGAAGLLTSLPATLSLGVAVGYVCLSAAQTSTGYTGLCIGDVTSQAAATSFAVGLSFAIGAGLPAPVALMHATVLLATCSLAALAYQLTALTVDREFPTPFSDNLAIRSDVIARTCLAPELAAPYADGTPPVQTVFQTPSAFSHAVYELQGALTDGGDAPFRGFFGQPTLTVYGEPGGGKSTSAVALAQALGRPGRPAMARAVHKDDLEQNQVGSLPVLALNLVCALLECDFRGRRDGVPVVLTIEEIESIFPRLDVGKADQQRYDENFLKSLGFLFFLQVLHLLSQTRSGVVIVATTNFAPEIRPLLDMLSTRAPVYFAGPTPQTQRSIVHAQLQSLSHSLYTQHGIGPLPLTEDKARLDAFLQATADRPGGTSGRDLTTFLRWGERSAIAERLRQQEEGAAAGDPASLVARVYECMHQALAHTPPMAAAKAAGAKQRLRAAAGAVGRQAITQERSDNEVLSNVEDVLRRLHVNDLEAAEVFEKLSQSVVNFGKAYADPSNTADIAQLKLRLVRTAFLFGQLQKRTMLESLPHRDFRDVPDVSPLKGFFGGDDPGAWRNFARTVKTWAGLNSAALVRYAQQAYTVSGFDIEGAFTRVQNLRKAVVMIPSQARNTLSGASSSINQLWR